MSKHPHLHGFPCGSQNWSNFPQRPADCSHPHIPQRNGPPSAAHPDQNRQSNLLPHPHRQHAPEALQSLRHAFPLDALPHQAEQILPVMAEGNWKPCQLIQQALPSQTPLTDKVRIPSPCEFTNILSTQDSSERVCYFNGISGHYPLSSHHTRAPSVTSSPRLHDAHLPRDVH